MELVKKFLFFLFLLFTCNYHYFPCIFSVFTWKKNSGSGSTAQAFRYRRTGTYTIINRALPRRWRILLCSRNTWLARSRTSYKRDTSPLALKQWGIMRDYSVLAHLFLSMYSTVWTWTVGSGGKGTWYRYVRKKWSLLCSFYAFACDWTIQYMTIQSSRWRVLRCRRQNFLVAPEPKVGFSVVF